MASESTVTVVGNITREPELRFLASGQANATLGLAVNRRWMDQRTQEWKEETSFFNVVCWGEFAENVTESLLKGTRVVVTGRLQQRKWETDEGEKRSVIEIVAEDIGPSLKWASAVVTKNERKSGGGAPQSNDAGYGFSDEEF